MRRPLAALLLALTALLIAAPAALGEALEPISGEGTYGEADDQVVTTAGFIIIIAVPLFVLCMSLLQGALERRKDRRKAAAKKLASSTSTHWQSGW
jgi:hypothetical protein